LFVLYLIWMGCFVKKKFETEYLIESRRLHVEAYAMQEYDLFFYKPEILKSYICYVMHLLLCYFHCLRYITLILLFPKSRYQSGNCRCGPVVRAYV
jgi:hypothetical protein